MELGLKGKVALITGGSSGIGLAVAQGLAAQGVHVMVCARNEKMISDAVDKIHKQYTIKTLGVPADVTKVEDVNAVISALQREFDGADILINNAGAGSEEKIETAPDERWQYFWDLLVMSAVRFSRALIPTMRKRGGGVILNNASICAIQPLDHEPIYNTTKAAMVMFSKCLANEVIKDNIRVNCINPGLIMTPAWRKGAESLGKPLGLTADEYMDKVARENTPIGRFASPEELANFFVFLCSERASYCVGSSYYVDGGWLKTTN